MGSEGIGSGLFELLFRQLPKDAESRCQPILGPRTFRVKPSTLSSMQPSPHHIIILSIAGGRCSVMKALCYKREGRGFETP
jgi:hypothetical protein